MLIISVLLVNADIVDNKDIFGPKKPLEQEDGSML